MSMVEFFVIFFLVQLLLVNILRIKDIVLFLMIFNILVMY